MRGVITQFPEEKAVAHLKKKKSKRKERSAYTSALIPRLLGARLF
jgi:hypothetical protein